MEQISSDPGHGVPPVIGAPQKPVRKKSEKVLFVVLCVVGLALISLAAGCIYFSRMAKNETAQIQKENKIVENVDTNPTFVLSSEFANYEDVPVNINPQVSAYTVDKDLKNVTNAKNFQLSDDAKKLLVQNAFVVVPGEGQEFYPLYEQNRYSFTPNFITTDSILHSYHLMFDDLLKKLEEDKLSSELKTLNAAMLADSLKQYDSLKGTQWENAAKRNVGFFAVGSRLLDPSVQTPEIVKMEVDQEMALIEAHGSIQESPVMNIGLSKDSPSYKLEAINEDYSQYIPRGHYTKSEELKAYFKSMMWYGRLTFRLKNPDEVKSALLISQALGSKGSNQESWDKIYEPINFFVGKSDDITYYQVRDVMKNVYGDNIALDAITKDDAKLSSFIDQMSKLPDPQINSIPIYNINLQPDRNTEIKGFRFMGQRFTIDSSIFQRLVVREVGRKDDKCSDAPFADGRFLPKGLDIPAAMGSGEAYNILQSEGDTDYACYKENMSKMKTYIGGLDKSVWTQNLYWGWLYSLKPLTEEKTTGYPSFMTNSAWQRKDLNTYLGSWTELRRDTILYVKQSYAERGGGGEDEPDWRGYVEPEPYVYARLASLIKMTSTGLEGRGLLSDKQKEDLDKLETIALNLKTISEKELNGTPLTDDENNSIKYYGGDLEHIWYEVFSTDGNPELDENSNSPVVADVATDPNDELALEEGDGYVSEIYAVVPVDGKLRIAKGAVYSHYEFTQPIDNRLTDEAWKAMLKDPSKVPALPDWTNMFVAK